MPTEVSVELVKIIPSLLWFLFFAILTILLYRPFKKELLPRLSGFKAFGIEANLMRKELDKASKVNGTELVDQEFSQILRRAQRTSQILQGTQILWIDDNPENIIHQINVLRTLSVFVEVAKSSEEALPLLLKNQYDIIISDVKRGETNDEGFRFLKELVKRGVERPFIFYTASYDKSNKGIPPHVFGIANHTEELFHLIMDATERQRG